MEYQRPNEWMHKGKRIVRDGDYYRVYGFRPWGDQPGEDFHRFRTISRAKEFIERMLKEAEHA